MGKGQMKTFGETFMYFVSEVMSANLVYAFTPINLIKKKIIAN